MKLGNKEKIVWEGKSSGFQKGKLALYAGFFLFVVFGTMMYFFELQQVQHYFKEKKVELFLYVLCALAFYGVALLCFKGRLAAFLFDLNAKYVVTNKKIYIINDLLLFKAERSKEIKSLYRLSIEKNTKDPKKGDIYFFDAYNPDIPAGYVSFFKDWIKTGTIAMAFYNIDNPRRLQKLLLKNK